MSNRDTQLPQGALYLSLGQGVFVLSGYLLHMFLGRMLSPALFGIFGVTMTILVWVEIAVNNGVPVALQKFLPDRALSEEAVLHAAARCQVTLGLTVFALMFLAAPWLAALLRDPNLTAYLRLALVDVLAMSAYAYYRGALNGWRAFRQLSFTIAAYSLTKLVAIVALVLLGLGLQGALLGNVVSSLGGLAVGYLWTRRRRARTVPDAGVGQIVMSDRTIMAFVLPAALFTLASNLLLGLDLMGVKALVADADQVGYYSAALKLAEAPRLVLLAFSFTLLPSLSHAIAAHDPAQTRHYLEQTIRLLAVVLLPILALVTASAPALITLTFSATYRAGAPILSVLIFTYAAYTVYITLVTALLAENKPRQALAIPALLLPLAVAAIWWGVSRFGPLGAAYASLLSVAIAAIVVMTYVLLRFKPRTGVLGRSLLRCALASAAIWGLARLWSPAGLLLLLAYGLLGLLYLVLLLLLGEIRTADLVLLASWLPQRKRGKGV